MKTRYIQSKDVAWRTLEGKSVLVNLDTQMTLMLNEVGSRIWELFESVSTIDDVSEIMASEFDAPGDAIMKDVEEFIRELLEKQLLVKAGGNDG
ncbi:MAG: PqqD family protein [Planctomycetota bacterium]